MIHNRWWLTQIPPVGSWTLTVPQYIHVGGCWHLSSPAGGGGRLRGRRGLEDAVQRERPRRRQRAQLPGPRGGRRGRFHFARGWTDDIEEHNGHETVQPALRHHVSQLSETLLLLLLLLRQLLSEHRHIRNVYSLTRPFVSLLHCCIMEFSGMVRFLKDFRFFFLSSYRQELVEQLQEAREEKKRLRKNLKEFEEQFFRQNGR